MRDTSPPTSGMRHVALYVQDLDACQHRYVEPLGMKIEWRPDADNVALQPFEGYQHLDYIGFMLNKPDNMDAWYKFFLSHKIKMSTKPRPHRDGARRYYCYAPDSNSVQMIFHPPFAGQWENV